MAILLYSGYRHRVHAYNTQLVISIPVILLGHVIPIKVD